MKVDSLLKFTTVSDMRKSLLYKLIEGPLSLTEIRHHFDVTSANVIPRIKDLIQMNLVAKEDGKFQLTNTGMMLAKNLCKMDNMAEIIEKEGRFLNDHDLSPIPDHLLDRIDELGDCHVISNGMENLSKTHDQIYDNFSMSKFVLGISPVFNSTYPGIYQNIAEQGTPVSLILSEPIFKKLETDPASLLKPYLCHANAKLYVEKDLRLILVVTDNLLSLYLYNKSGTLDIINSLMSFDESAIKWGKELFEEHRSRSRDIKN